MADKNEKVLINKTPGRFTINFLGAFQQNKWANENGKIYLTDKEWDWVKINIPHILEAGKLVEEGTKEAKEPIADPEADREEYAKFFKQHVNKAKSQASKMEDLDKVNALLDYADENEINNKAVDALIDKANELGE